MHFLIWICFIKLLRWFNCFIAAFLSYSNISIFRLFLSSVGFAVRGMAPKGEMANLCKTVNLCFFHLLIYFLVLWLILYYDLFFLDATEAGNILVLRYKKNVARGYLMEGFVAHQCGRKQTLTTQMHGLRNGTKRSMSDCSSNLTELMIHIAQGR